MPYSIRLPVEIEDRIKYLAAQTGRRRSFFINKAIIENIDDIEELYISEKRLENICSGKTKTILLQEVMKCYEMDC